MESDEHKWVGDIAAPDKSISLTDDDGNITITLTFWEVIALAGDFFGTASEII